MSNITQPHKHGDIIAVYAVVYDRNLDRTIIVPATLTDIRRGTIRLP
ncbi:hypothetical protein [Geobacter sulfurreducens]|nr:hypothetical protein [Geobacter sulfurreducens]BBA71729.1 hypothetical protein YM18_3221 [Geobacter sulfurreducens]